MLLDILFLVGGLLLILAGANGLTDGASAVAKRFNISDLVIGLTIVAFGTSMPELVISCLAAIKGNPDMAIGNVVGSNIFNILGIIGVTAVVMPVTVGKGTLAKEIPFVILSALAIVFVALDAFFDGGTQHLIGRGDGLILLLFFAIFMVYTFAIAKHSEAPEEDAAQVKLMPMWKATIWILGGLAALIGGGQLFVEGASQIARSMGVSDSIIGLTLVAVGTSLPELATSVTAALKKNPGIAVGNVIGSNLFNAFFILGTAATISPLPMGGITWVDMAVLVFASVLFWLVGWAFKKRTITRGEGVLMVLCYVAYTAYLISQQGA